MKEKTGINKRTDDSIAQEEGGKFGSGIILYRLHFDIAYYR
jgi:hypothetical protein